MTAYTSAVILLSIFIHLTMSRIDINPQCGTQCDIPNDNGTYLNLAHSTFKDQNRTYHTLISSIGAPAVILGFSDQNSELKIDWTKLRNFSQAITFQPALDFSFAYVFPKLIEFNDSGDNADISKGHNISAINLADMKWDYSKNLSGETVFVLKTLHNDSDDMQGDGFLQMKFGLYSSDGRMPQLPKLQTKMGSVSMQLVLDDFRTPMKGMRYAIQVVSIENSSATKAHAFEYKSIDDEYSPGVFRMINWPVPLPAQMKEKAFLQFRPVCYTKPHLNREFQTKATFEQPKRSNATESMESIVYGLYGENLVTQMRSEAMNVTFGLPKDGYYAKTHFHAWALSIGYGDPPEDKMSALVVIVIACGVGIPICVIIIGVVALLLRNRNKIEGYEEPDAVVT